MATAGRQSEVCVPFTVGGLSVKPMEHCGILILAALHRTWAQMRLHQFKPFFGAWKDPDAFAGYAG
eukprot:8509309-Alexandrium_andersonii.AAC.1